MNKQLVKRIIYFLLGILLLLIVWQYELVNYGIAQGRGQLKIIWGATPISEILNDPHVHDTIKYKLSLIQEIRHYAFDSLGINESKNYTTYYDQKGQPLLWVITGCEPYELKAKEWKFPIIGTVTYKGFFDLEKAKKEELILKAQNFDTNLGTVGGWSTLGWFKDPVLSNMLKRDEGELANLIIHELTHGTLFVKDSVSFNENLASFIGDKGAQKFLIYKFGPNSPEYLKYVRKMEDRTRFTDHVLKGAALLDTLYNSINELEKDEIKIDKKYALISEITTSIDSIPFHSPDYYRDYFSQSTPNNTFFMAYLRYSAKLDNLEHDYEVNFNSNLKKYLEHLKSIFPSL